MGRPRRRFPVLRPQMLTGRRNEPRRNTQSERFGTGSDMATQWPTVRGWNVPRMHDLLSPRRPRKNDLLRVPPRNPAHTPSPNQKTPRSLAITKPRRQGHPGISHPCASPRHADQPEPTIGPRRTPSPAAPGPPRSRWRPRGRSHRAGVRRRPRMGKPPRVRNRRPPSLALLPVLWPRHRRPTRPNRRRNPQRLHPKYFRISEH
ncbi:peptidyl-prolyl cis-trans isomerase CYP95-like isoform X2 [uncultured Mediterranean phage uvDeep-CGR2-AD7-C12]|nr:peptidyl-prolyl cis-trans isomerase CYP95-like isoform X2 [uncultured Mediterranean phage uvDeep-CGR2-AD7-C12]